MTEEFMLAPQTSHRTSATRIPHRETAGQRVILVVEDDWRTRHFICTVLKYSGNALVIESSSPHNALFVARELEYRIDLLIANIDLGDAKTGMGLAREIVGHGRKPAEVGRTPWSAAGPPARPSEVRRKLPEPSGFSLPLVASRPCRQDDNPPAGPWRGGPPESNPATRVLLISGRRNVPPCDIPPTWKFLSIPFPTAAFLNYLSELCGEFEQPK
jgi:hypothetical protein